MRRQVLEAYSEGQPKCACCAERHVEFLAIDHVNGGGEKHRKTLGSKGGETFYRWLIQQQFPPGFRVLCHNCNFAYGVYGYCPHHLSERKKE